MVRASLPFEIAVVALATSCELAVARAEPNIGVEPPASFVAGDPSLLAPSPGARGEQQLRLAAYVDYVRAPFTLVAPNQQRRAVVEEQLWARVAASFSLHHRFLFGLELPALLRERGDAQPFAVGVPAASEGVALGDPRVSVRARVLGHASGFALGVGARASLPLASQTYAGASSAALGAFVSAGHDAERSFSALALGFTWRKAQTLPGILPTRVGSDVSLALATGVALDPAGRTRLGPELAATFVVGSGASLFDPRSTACALLLHLQHRIAAGPFAVGLAGGPHLGRAPGAADYRAVLSLVFSPEAPAPPPDADDDRVADDLDMCPRLAGERSEDPLMNGCPAIPSDADGDGVPDLLDACPQTVGEPSVVKQRHGCPKPPPPPPPKVALEREQIAITEQVQFETGTAVLRDVSADLLGQVAKLLEQHPEIELCEIAGHTDATGPAASNQELSLERARAVMDWLVTHGVAAERLLPRGYGQSRPVADNAIEAGRARNRRVEFLILRRSSPPAEAR